MSGAFIVLLLIYGTLWTPGTGYLMQKISLCSYSDNKQGNITFATGFTLNRQLLLSYSKPDEMYITCPSGCIREMGIVAASFATLLNTNPNTATQVKKEEERCKDGVKKFWDKTVERRVKPSVEVFLPVQLHPDSLPVLVCQVWGFYPQDISVAWFKNDKLVKNYTEAVRTGDWTYRILATLDLRNFLPKDNYTCLVNHPTLDTPIVKTWKHGLTNIQIIKISVASVVFALGLVCLITGIVCWKNAKRSGYSPIPGYNDEN
ncbi:PREDICTED: HLA class II histocompatibility antigen, DM beta chain [Nanorana parkeri]|uniref:HLA class II histocompatibility antigen, DM beta chain n=1 Tax=Nanorana parkeri TaxID=125878 RepID=UPI000854D55F|nr:PREDICTED: HLA class II histocompatibility antigen, DM beta chain [Nanorana parkeri]